MKRDFYVDGMHCEMCAEKVEEAIKIKDSQAKVKVNLTKKSVHISSVELKAGDVYKSAIEDAGFVVLREKTASSVISTVVKCILVPLIAIAGWYIMQILVQFISSFAVSIINVRVHSGEAIDVIEEKTINFLYNNIMSMYVIAGVAFIVLIYLLSRVIKYPDMVGMKSGKIGVGLTVLSIGIGTFVGVILNCFITVLSDYLPQTWINANRESVGSVSTGNVFVVIVATVVFAPVIEEILFRGLLYNALKKLMNLIPINNILIRRKLSIFSAAVISSVAFGVFHGNILQGIYTCVFAFVMAWIYEESGSLITSILVHAAFNFAGLATTVMVNLMGYSISIGVSLLISALLVVVTHILCKRKVKNIYI